MQHPKAQQFAQGLFICARPSQAVVDHNMHTNTIWLAEVISSETALSERTLTQLFSWQRYLR